MKFFSAAIAIAIGLSGHAPIVKGEGAIDAHVYVGAGMCVDGNEGQPYNFKQILVPEEYFGGENQLPYCATNCIAHAFANEEGLKHYVGFNYVGENQECLCYYSRGFTNEDLTFDGAVGSGTIEETDGNVSNSFADCFKNQCYNGVDSNERCLWKSALINPGRDLKGGKNNRGGSSKAPRSSKAPKKAKSPKM